MNRKSIIEAVRTTMAWAFPLAKGTSRGAGRSFLRPHNPRRPAPFVEAPPHRKVGKNGLDLIKSFEGCEKKLPDGRFKAYPDPGSADGHPWTIGWGSTGAGVKKGTIWTRRQCDTRFERDIQRYADAVSRALGDAPTTQNQFDALVSFHYNTGAIAKATLTRKHKAGRFGEAKAEFARWNNNDGRPMRGLTRRRAAEAELYARP